MKRVDSFLPATGEDVVNRLKATKQRDANSTGFEETMVKAWRMLEAWKKVHSPVGSTEYKAWKQGMSDLTPEEVECGLNKARYFTGFFDLSAFLSLCRRLPEDIGLPDKESAWSEACQHCHHTRNHKWSHVAVYKALTSTGIFEMRNMTDVRQTRKIFERNYEIVCRALMNGEDLGDIPQALPKEIRRASTPESQGYRDFKKCLEDF